MFFGIAVAFLAGEIFLRVVEPKTIGEIFTSEALPSGKFYIHPIPNSTGVILGRPVAINAAGFRGQLVSKEKERDVIRIGVFGDSHTFGWGADDNSSYPAVTERVLNANGRHYEVLNFGVGGHDWSQLMHHARIHAFRFQLDVVLLTFHQGDLLEDASGDLIVDRGEAPPSASCAPAGIKQRLRHLEDRVSAVSAVGRLLVPQLSHLLRWTGILHSSISENELDAIERNDPRWLQMRGDLIQFKEEAKRQNCEVIVALFPHMQPFASHPAKPLYGLLEERFRELGLPSVNLLPAFHSHSVGSLYASFQDHHPNEKGYAIAGECVARFMASHFVANEAFRTNRGPQAVRRDENRAD